MERCGACVLVRTGVVLIVGAVIGGRSRLFNLGCYKLSLGNAGANRTNACSVFVVCRLKSCQRWAEVVIFVPTLVYRLYILWRPWGKIITDSIEAFRVHS